MNYRISANRVVEVKKLVSKQKITVYVDILTLDGGFGSKEMSYVMSYAVAVATNKYSTLYQYNNLILNLESHCYWL